MIPVRVRTINWVFPRWLSLNSLNSMSVWQSTTLEWLPGIPHLLSFNHSISTGIVAAVRRADFTSVQRLTRRWCCLHSNVKVSKSHFHSNQIVMFSPFEMKTVNVKSFLSTTVVVFGIFHKKLSFVSYFRMDFQYYNWLNPDVQRKRTWAKYTTIFWKENQHLWVSLIN